MTTKVTEKASPRKSEHLLNKKWGNDVLAHGFTSIPNVLLERQKALGLDSTSLNILLVLIKHWWDNDKKPFPSKKLIAEHIDRDTSTVQRHMRKLEENGLIKRKVRRDAGGGQTSNEHDLSGLLQKLKTLSVEKTAIINEGKQKESSVRRRKASSTGTKGGPAN